MTLPELCECIESPEDMPNINSITSTTNSIATTGPCSGIVVSKSSSSNSSSSSTVNNHPHSYTAGLGEALKALLRQAASQGRVTCSLTSCVDLLSARPDDVMLCVMPLLAHPDAAATIQSTLIRAVCLEHNIRILSVDCDVKLAKTVVGGSSDDDNAGEAASAIVSTRAIMAMEEEEEEENVDDNCNKVWKTPSACSEDVPLFFTACDNLAPVMGFPCVLVRYPMDGASKEEELVAEFCKEQIFDQAHQDPYIELPD